MFWTASGNTEKVARAIEDGVRSAGAAPTVVKTADAGNIELYDYDLVFFGCPTYSFLPPEPVLAYVKQKMKVHGERGEVRLRAPKVPGKRAVPFVTYAGPHTGAAEAIPVGKYLGQLFEHLGFDVVDEWYVVGEHHTRPTYSTDGRLGDIRGRPTQAELTEIAAKAVPRWWPAPPGRTKEVREMPKAFVNGANLYYEVTGAGFPLVWSHEFAGDYRSWEAQARFFSRRYKVITYNHRGYPPSDVPEDPAAYSLELLVDDLYHMLRQLGIEKAYVGGLSMGGGVALNFTIAHPEMVKAAIVAGTGSGTVNRAEWEKQSIETAALMESQGMAAAVDAYGKRGNRAVLQRKDPRTYREFCEQFASHSGVGSARIIRGVQLKRRTIFELEGEMKKITAPVLIMVGDSDDACVEPSVFMKRHIPNSGLIVFPRSGHAINIEEPKLFNRSVQDFLTQVESGRW